MIITFIYVSLVAFAVVIVHAAICAFASLRLCVKNPFPPPAGCVAPLDAGSPAALRNQKVVDSSQWVQKNAGPPDSHPGRPATHLIKRQILAKLERRPEFRHRVTRHPSLVTKL